MAAIERPLQAAFLAGLFALVLFLPTLSHDFVNWDDHTFVRDNPPVCAAAGLERIWSTIELPEEFPNYPLFHTSLWLDCRLWGLSAAGFHATNVFLHAANTVLVLVLARVLGLSAAAAFLAALLFAAHPVQVETVAWISQRKTLLSTFFYLAALLAYLRHRKTGREAWYAASLSAFVAALLAKTATLSLPVSLLALELVRRDGSRHGPFLRLLPMFCLSAAAAIVTAAVEPIRADIPLAIRPLLVGATLSFYASELVLPWRLLPVHPLWDVSWSIRWMLPPVLVLGVAILLIRRGRWLERWAGVHFAVALLPVSGVLTFGYSQYSFVADHHLYLASIAVLIALASGFQAWRESAASRVPDLLAVLVVLALVGVTLRQATVWHDSESLWRYVTERNPTASVAFNNLGLVLMETGRLDEAKDAVEEAVRLKPNYGQAWNNLGLIAQRRRDPVAAENHFRTALRHLRDAPRSMRNRALANLGVLLEEQRRTADALTLFRAAATEDSGNAMPHYLTGNAQAQSGDLTAALDAYDRAAQLDPTFGPAYSERGRVQLAQGRALDAIESFRQAQRLLPPGPIGHFNLALAYARAGMLADAVRELRRAIEIDPQFTPARAELAKLEGRRR